MINVGDVIEIGGNEATICYKTVYENHKYICVAFEGEGIRYDIYEYKDDDNRLLVAKIEDPKEAAAVIELFVQEGISEYGLPDCFKKLLDKINE